jgi:hypothetical protein
MITQSINFQFTTTSSVQFLAPVKRITVLDSSNFAFLRQVMLSNDGVQIIRGNYSIQFPMQQLFRAAATAFPSMSWAPVISPQPSNVTLVTSSAATSTASLFATASDEFGNDMTYQWYVSASYTSGFTLPAGVNYQGTSSANISASYSGSIATDQDKYYFFCAVSNPSGTTSSSIATVTLT